MSARRLFLTGLTLLVALAMSAPACSQETRDKVKGAGRSAQRDAEALGRQTEARTAAEALRVALKSEKDKNGRSMKNISHAVRTYASRVPGNPQISGAVDANSDGRDDDGKIQVNVGDKSACVVLPATGSDTTVRNGRC